MYLLGRDTVSASQLARRFEVSRRTIQRDIDALCRAGIPVTAAHGAEGGYAIVDGFKLTRQIAGKDDYQNIITALKGLDSAYENERVQQTLEKALATMRGGEQRVFIDFAVAREGALGERLRAIEKAIEDGTPLKITYSNAEGVLTERVIEPLALSFQWYAWYLFAYCRQKQGYRTFKLARIAGMEAAQGTFTKAHGNVEALMHAAARTDTRELWDIRLLCKAEARMQIVEYINGKIVGERENGDFVMALNVPMERMWFSLLMGFGAQIEVLAPEKLKVLLRERAQEILSPK